MNQIENPAKNMINAFTFCYFWEIFQNQLLIIINRTYFNGLPFSTRNLYLIVYPYSSGDCTGYRQYHIHIHRNQ